MKLNINDTVKVKLTDAGIAILRKNHDELARSFPKLGDFKLPIVDPDGYSSFQLWGLMETFGPYMHIGFKVPFETEIVVNDKD